MTETEIKLRVADPASARKLLTKAGFKVLHPRVFEANLVLDTPERTLSGSGRLLRLREAGRKVTLTVKGPPKRSRHKSRPEFEMPLQDLATAVEIFLQLGYQQVFRYEKYRTEFRQVEGTGIAVLDETPIGTFLELEGAGAWIDKTAKQLGFSRQFYILESYGALHMKHCEELGRKRGNMVFRSRE